MVFVFFQNAATRSAVPKLLTTQLLGVRAVAGFAKDLNLM
jgi:hypothetical protein